jgi:hypothetical protein
MSVHVNKSNKFVKVRQKPDSQGDWELRNRFVFKVGIFISRILPSENWPISALFGGF